MANIKITDLTAYGNPTSTDVLPIVDVGADVTKKVSVGDLLENAGSGTAAAPGIAFDGDPNTGIYRPGADQVAISTNGTGRLFVDASGHVGLGTSSPSEVLHVQTGSNGSVQIGADGGSQSASKIFNSSGTLKLESIASDLILTSARHFRFEDETGSPFGRWASDGRLGVGTTSPSTTLEVIGNAQIGATSYPIRFETDASTGVIQYPATSSRSVLRTLGSTPLEFEINSGNPVARIDSSGRLLVGTSTAASTQGGNLQVDTDACIRRNVDSNGGPALRIEKTRASSDGTYSVVSNEDSLGELQYFGADGTKLIQAASITAEVDGTPGVDDMPGRLVFSVTADGSASPTEAMRIKNSRVINFSNAPVYADNAAAKTGGLVNGDVYRTSTGDLKIVYT